MPLGIECAVIDDGSWNHTIRFEGGQRAEERFPVPAELRQRPREPPLALRREAQVADTGVGRRERPAHQAKVLGPAHLLRDVALTKLKRATETADRCLAAIRVDCEQELVALRRQLMLTRRLLASLQEPSKHEP